MRLILVKPLNCLFYCKSVAYELKKMGLNENNAGKKEEEEAHHSIKHHLISLPVLDLVVQVLRQVQTPVNVLLKPNGALQGKQSVRP